MKKSAPKKEIYHSFLARGLLRQLLIIAREIEGTKRGRDVESIHRMRVASRRLRTTLWLYKKHFSSRKSRNWVKKFKTNAKALGDVRDMDVHIDFIEKFIRRPATKKYRFGINRLHTALTEKRKRIQNRVIQMVSDLEQNGTIEEMKEVLQLILKVRPVTISEVKNEFIFKTAKSSVTKCIDELLSFEFYVQRPERCKELHEMRIAAKHLRYTLEIFEPLYGRRLSAIRENVRKIQQLLGGIHDCDVWNSFLPRFLIFEKEVMIASSLPQSSLQEFEKGIRYFIKERTKFRFRMYEQFTRLWERISKEKMWDKLKELLQEPLNVRGC